MTNHMHTRNMTTPHQYAVIDGVRYEFESHEVVPATSVPSGSLQSRSAHVRRTPTTYKFKGITRIGEERKDFGDQTVVVRKSHVPPKPIK